LYSRKVGDKVTFKEAFDSEFSSDEELRKMEAQEASSGEAAL
jgi:hypothetical protein